MLILNLKDLKSFDHEKMIREIFMIVQTAGKIIMKSVTEEETMQAERILQSWNQLFSKNGLREPWNGKRMDNEITEWYFSLLGKDEYSGISDKEIQVDVAEWLDSIYPEQLSKAVGAFCEYCNQIVFAHNKSQILKMNIVDAEDRKNYQNDVMEMDQTRRKLHNEAMSSLQKLNDICKQKDYDLIYPSVISHEERSVVANAIFNFLKWWNSCH